MDKQKASQTKRYFIKLYVDGVRIFNSSNPSSIASGENLHDAIANEKEHWLRSSELPKTVKSINFEIKEIE